MTTEVKQRVPVSLEQAMERLAITYDPDDGAIVHTQVNPAPGIFVGADWDLVNVKSLIVDHGCSEAGPHAKAMRHGLVVIEPDGRAVFLETKEAEA